MSQYDPHEYAIAIQKVVVEGEIFFEATVRELPDLRDYGESPHEAYVLMIDSISTAMEVYQEQKRAFPPPAITKDNVDFSGRVTLRMPKTLHARIAASADYEGVSLNSYITTVLAYHVGRRLGERPGGGYSATVFPIRGKKTTKSEIRNVVSIDEARPAVYV